MDPPTFPLREGCYEQNKNMNENPDNTAHQIGDEENCDEENFEKFVRRYRQVFQLDNNHPGEAIAISLSCNGERVFFHTETRSEPYQADKSTMDAGEWRALTEWIEKHEEEGPWVIIPGVNENEEHVDLTGEEEERLLSEESDKNEERLETDDETRESEMSREKTIKILTKGSDLGELKNITFKKSDEVLKIIKDFCITSTNTMKQYQEVLIGAQAAVKNMEAIHKSIINEFEKQKEVFSKQTKAIEQKGIEVNRQLVEMRANYNKILNHYCSGPENKNGNERSARDETTSQNKRDELNVEVSRLVRRELEKIKLSEKGREKENSDSLVDKVKETLKLEIISKDSGLRREYRLTSNTKFEHFYDYFTSELRTLELLYIIDPDIASNRVTDAVTVEKHKYKVRDILINHLDQNYHSKVIHIKDPVEILNKIKELKKCESNLTSTTIRKQLYNMQFYPNKENASDFCDKFEDVVRNYENLSGVMSLSEGEKRDAFFNAIMTTVPEVQSVEFMTKNSTGQGLSYDQLKLFLLQAEANKNQSVSSETRAVMKAHGRDERNRCYECDDNGHLANTCRFRGTGLKKCYECGQITNHKASECPIKRIKQTKFERGRPKSYGFNRGHYSRYKKYGNNLRCGNFGDDYENRGFKRKAYEERSGDAKRFKNYRGRGNYQLNNKGNKNQKKQKEKDGGVNSINAKHAKGM